MAIADPLSRLSRQEHRVDNLDLPLLLEMLLTELPEEIRKLEHFQEERKVEIIDSVFLTA